MRLEGKVAIVSGGARGQGAAEARLFAREGAAVIIGDILDEEGLRLEAEIRELGAGLPTFTWTSPRTTSGKARWSGRSPSTASWMSWPTTRA